MAIFGGDYGSIYVATIPEGGELERTVSECSIACFHYKDCILPNVYEQQYCRYFMPISPHLYYKGSFYN
jgi:hypothetical protein